MKCKCGNILTRSGREFTFTELFESVSDRAEFLITVVMDETEKGCCRSEASKIIVGMIMDLEHECEQLGNTLENI